MLQKNNIPDIRRLLRDSPGRIREMVRHTGCWRCDFSRTPLDEAAWSEAHSPSRVEPLASAVDALLAGEIVNPSERRPALHHVLRSTRPSEALAAADARVVEQSRARMLETAGRLHRGESGLRTLIHVGIGGSDLGPRLVADALDGGDAAVEVEWLTTLDARRVRAMLRRLDPTATGLVVASKSFSTVETLTQAAAIRDWLGPDAGDRIWAATARPERATEFGVDADRVLEFPDTVGGRYSLWSGVGVSAAARIGPDRWNRLLAGARAVDRQVADSLSESPALALAVVVDALVRSFGFGTLGVVAYEPGLRLLAEFLQQLVMESLGKSVDIDGRPVRAPTAPLVFGGTGTDLQHSLFQALHQGTVRHPMLLLGSVSAVEGFADWQREQLAHLLGQASALVAGRTDEAPERVLPGNNPVITMLTRTLEPASLGELLATFEHAVYLLGTIWGINPFDQWGVEEGKRLAGRFRQALRDGGESPDSSLDELLAWIREQDGR